jgi:hypothetical protein
MSSFTPSHWDELVSLRRECLALRLKCAQLEDVVKQRDSEVGARMTQEAREEATYWHVADPDGERPQGQPAASAGDVEQLRDPARWLLAPGLPKAFSQESDL